MSPRKQGRRALPGFGIRGKMGRHGAYVRAFLERGLVRVYWTEDKRRRMESWPDTPENRELAAAFAGGVAERLRRLALGEDDAPRYEPLTVRDLWTKFVEGETAHLRVNAFRVMHARWRKFEQFVGLSKLVSDVKRETLDKYRAELRRVKHAPNQIARHVQVVKQVFTFGVDRDLIAPTKVTTYSYKRSRDEQAMKIPEYSPAEARALLAACDPRDSRTWRLYVALYVFAFAGPRQNAARHLEWRDVDFSAGTVRWRPEFDKLGYDRTQLLPAPVLEALRVAYGWRTAYGYEGPLVFFRPGAGSIDRGGWHTERKAPTQRSLRRAAAKPDKPWTYQAFNGALRRLEDDAGVPHVKHRAAHGFRRYVVNEVLAATGNLVLAGQYVGDKDVRTLARSYVRERPEELRNVVSHLERSVQAPGASRNENATDLTNEAPTQELPPE